MNDIGRIVWQDCKVDSCRTETAVSDVLELDFESAKGAVGRARSKAIASASVFVTGPAIDRARSLADALRLAPFGYVFHVMEASRALAHLDRPASVAVYVCVDTFDEAVSFARAARAAVPASILVVAAETVDETLRGTLIDAGYDVAIELAVYPRPLYRQIAALVQRRQRPGA